MKAIVLNVIMASVVVLKRLVHRGTKNLGKKLIGKARGLKLSNAENRNIWWIAEKIFYFETPQQNFKPKVLDLVFG